MRVHPRVCGESEGAYRVLDYQQGPSPRVRGIRRHRHRPQPDPGSIPACAGNPSACLSCSGWRTVHPRVCGESAAGLNALAARHGPSPRVRGIPPERSRFQLLVGSIPACAGNPLARPNGRRPQGVHPRVCGESEGMPEPVRELRGPSPRVRGIQSAKRSALQRPGSIPACAGNPAGIGTKEPSRGVHPRVCGESSHTSWMRFSVQGPSPRVRGIPATALACSAHQGSIPACAGNPGTGARRPGSRRVHPRVCGESSPAGRPPVARAGPSPRVRGIPLRTTVGGIGRGSIPACAGNPRVWTMGS